MEEEEREKTQLTSREGFDRFTHYVANIYGTTNVGACCRGSTGLQWMRGYALALGLSRVRRRPPAES